MYRRFLTNNGMSMTQVQTLSNLLNQRCEDINSVLDNLNNFSRKIVYNGEELEETQAHTIPSDIMDILLEKCELHACQAFLMECVKAKESMLTEIKNSTYVPEDLIIPTPPKFEQGVIEPYANETWGFNQLSDEDIAKYTYDDTVATHYGKFFHKNSPLDRLRKELPTLKSLDWFQVSEEQKIPVKIYIHNKQDDLLALHTSVATKHREHEKDVNYIKAKVKNMVSEKNAEINKNNALKIAEINAVNDKLRNDYNSKLEEYNGLYNIRTKEFESNKELKLKNIAALRINCPSTFQPIINKYKDLLGL